MTKRSFYTLGPLNLFISVDCFIVFDKLLLLFSQKKRKAKAHSTFKKINCLTIFSAFRTPNPNK